MQCAVQTFRMFNAYARFKGEKAHKNLAWSLLKGRECMLSGPNWTIM